MSRDPNAEESPTEASLEGSAQADTAAAEVLATDQVAPPGRFSAARTNIGAFTNNGSQSTMRRGVAQYVRNGYGGAATFSRRMAGTARSAATLDGVLRTGALRDGHTIQDQVLASSGDVNEVLDSIVNAAVQSDGTQDAEASRRSMRDALTDLLERFPEATLGSLDQDQRMYVIERYTARDVFARFCLDMQKHVMGKASDPATGLTRLRQIREYIASTVARAFRSLRDSGQPTGRSVAALTRAALSETFRVFEEYL